VKLVEVGAPVEGSHVEGENIALRPGERVVQGLTALVVEDRFGLGVAAVELRITLTLLEFVEALVDALGARREALTGKMIEHSRRRLERTQTDAQPSFHRSASGEGPQLGKYRLAVLVVIGMFVEVVVHEMNQVAIEHRIA
jgi:hypothetical protein